MNAFDLLKADHERVAELFDLMEKATGKRKLELFKQIKSELDVHTHIEEKIFYPALEKPEDTHDLTLEAYEEHEVVKTLLSELSKSRTASDEWQAKAKVLRENVDHHVEEEENELFDKASDVLSDEEVETLGDRMAAEKAKKTGRPVEKQKANGPGIISKIANLVGLGGSAIKTASKKSTKNTGARKSSSKKGTKSSPKSTKGRTTSSKSAKRNASSKSAGTKKQSSKGRASKKNVSTKRKGRK